MNHIIQKNLESRTIEIKDLKMNKLMKKQIGIKTQINIKITGDRTIIKVISHIMSEMK